MTEDEGMLARLDERTEAMQASIGRIEETCSNLDNVYVRRSEFADVKKIVYTGVGLVLVTVLVAVLANVISA
jgi:hypothetical protein